MNNNLKGLSIIITYYLGDKFIEKCLDSIFQAYNASEKKLNYEIILVIDSIEDADWLSAKLMIKYEIENLIIIKNEKNLGVSKSRNIGLAKIKYNFFTIVDQDDFVNLNYFLVLENSLKDEVDIYIMNGVVLFEGTKKRIPIFYFKPNFSFESLILQTTIILTPGLMVFNRNNISTSNFFIETSLDYKGSDDWAAYLNILLSTQNVLKFKFINSLLFVYCLHNTNYSNNKEEMELSSLSVINFFLNKKSIRKGNNYKIILKAKKRNKFLFSYRIEHQSLIKLAYYYPYQIIYHYFLSFFKRDRLNRLIFRIRQIL